ncbi:MAG TPA: hypothetical protein IGP91_11295, partial [Thermosynechococcus sp. M46_R2017_013]|nr:hypothetical protein [Thermosynechococcus sp. M46_R2017_013]
LKGELEYCLNSLPNMYEAAPYVGGKLREVTESHRLSLGGQEPYLYFIYSQDNFLQATPETPFLQMGETKYDKPILARTLRFDTAVDAGLLTLDSTMKSNISVGSPLDLILYRTDNFEMRSITAPNFSWLIPFWQGCGNSGRHRCGVPSRKYPTFNGIGASFPLPPQWCCQHR